MEKTVDRPGQKGRTASEILAELRGPILLGLSRAMRGAFAGSVDELLERLLSERSWDIRQRIDDSLDLLRNGREGIEAKFDQACNEEWASRTGHRDRPVAAAEAPKPSGLSLSLSLVDDNAIGDQLTVGRVASRIRRRLDEEQIDGLRARFGLLLDRDWFADNDFPIAPDVILECLRKALAAFGPAPVVAYLLDSFEPKLSAELATLYAEVNAQMVKRGVMPEIRYHVAKPVGAGGGAGGGDGAGGTAGFQAGDEAGLAPAAGYPGAMGSAAMMGAAGMGPVAMGPAGMGGAFMGGAGPAGAMAGAGGVGHGPGFDASNAGQARFFSADGHEDGPAASVHAGPGGAGHGGQASAGHGGRMAPAMMPVTEVRSLVRQMGQRNAAAQGSATRYLSDPTRFGFQHDNLPALSQPLIAALSVLQEAEPSPGSNVSEQADKVREHSVEAAEEHGTPLERLIIETVSLVFDNVYEDPAIADSIKQQLLRLQVAAFKAALIDPSFFARPEHPMRRLIDRIASMGSDPDFETGQGSPLVGDVASLVTWILGNFDRELGVIEEALERLDGVVEAETARRAERLAKIATAAARTEKLERTRDDVREELTRSIRRSTPEFVARFIADQWTEVIARLRNGADYAPFDEGRARRTVQKLIWSVAPKKALEIRKLAAELPQLIADLSRGLSFVATSEAERELFFSELLAWHGAAIAEAKRQSAVKEAQRSAGIDVAYVDEADEEEEEFDENFDAAPAAAAGTPAGQASTPAADPPIQGMARPANASATAGDPGARPEAGGLARTGAAADQDDDQADRGEDGEMDAVEALDLTNGIEIELHSVKGEVKRFKLGWMSPARTVFIFSRYPKDHWTVRRPMLNQLLEQGRIRILSRPAKTNQVIESLKAR